MNPPVLKPMKKRIIKIVYRPEDGAPERPGSFTEFHLALIRGSFQEKEVTAAQQHMILQEMIALCKKQEQRKNASFSSEDGH